MLKRWHEDPKEADNLLKNGAPNHKQINAQIDAEQC